ncbi:MAG: hypothetical protein JXX28_00835 [Deltaproteobacteria bacterium]|nr:hypothetical protein [Deltaproteobacteria bacterium]
MIPRLTAVSLGLLALTGCDLFLVERLPPGAPTPRYPTLALPVRCEQSPLGMELLAVDPTGERLLLQQGRDPSAGGTILRHSDDWGASWDNLAVVSSTLNPYPTWTPWGGRPSVSWVRDGVWGVMGPQWAELVGGTGRPILVYTADGGATWTQHLGEEEVLRVDGVPTDAVYRLSEQDAIAVIGGLSFASTDGGATWASAGSTSAWARTEDYEEYDLLDTRDGVAVAWMEPRDGLSQGYLLRPGEAPEPLPRAVMGTPQGALLSGGVLAAVTGTDMGGSNPFLALTLTELATGAQTAFPLERSLSQIALFRDGGDRVWVSATVRAYSYAVDRDGQDLTWRYDPATGVLEEVLFDVGTPLALRVIDGAPRRDGATLLVWAPAYDDGSGAPSFLPLLDGSREAWRCAAGEDVTEGAVALCDEGTPAHMAAGRLYPHALRGAQSLHTDKLALDPSGVAFVASQAYVPEGGLGTVRAAPSPSAPLLLHEGTALEDSVWGVDAPSAGGVRALRGPPEGTASAAYQQMLDANTGEASAVTPLPFDRTVYELVDVPGDTLARTAGGALSLGAARSILGPTQEVRFPRFLYTRGSHGVVVDQGVLDLYTGANALFPRYFTPFNPGDGALPDPLACTPETCIHLDGVIPADVEVGDAGDLYVLDGIRGQVWLHEAGAPLGAWEVVAAGLFQPSDMALREEADRTLVYVLDGPVWVFDAIPGEVAR